MRFTQLTELLVAFATCAFFREAQPPLNGEQRPSVIESEEVDHRNPWHSQQVLVPVRSHLSCPLLQGIVELFWIPTKLSLDQQIHRAGMVTSMLQDKLLPRQGQEVGEGMCQVLLEFVGRESHSMHHVVIDVDLLNADVSEGNSKAQRARPVVLWKCCQGSTVGQNHHALQYENGRQHIPHVHLVGGFNMFLPSGNLVLFCSQLGHPSKIAQIKTCLKPLPKHHLLRRNLREQEGQILWHWIWLVGNGKETPSFQAPVLVVLLHTEDLLLTFGQ